MNYIIWTEAEAKANALLGELQQQVRYPWAYRKLRSARFHIIENHTVSIGDLDWKGERFVTNGEVPE